MSFKVGLTRVPALPNEDTLFQLTYDELENLLAAWNKAADWLMKWLPPRERKPKSAITTTSDELSIATSNQTNLDPFDSLIAKFAARRADPTAAVVPGVDALIAKMVNEEALQMSDPRITVILEPLPMDDDFYSFLFDMIEVKVL